MTRSGHTLDLLPADPRAVASHVDTELSALRYALHPLANPFGILWLALLGGRGGSLNYKSGKNSCPKRMT